MTHKPLTVEGLFLCAESVLRCMLCEKFAWMEAFMAYTDTFPIVGNFIETNLTTDVIASDTTIYLSDVSEFPNVTAGRDHIPCVIRGANTEEREIVYVTAVDRSTSAVTVSRGMEGTEAKAWPRASYLYCTLTAWSAERLRINGFAPVLDENGNRPAMTWVKSTSFSIAGDYRNIIEVNSAVRVISNGSVVNAANVKNPIHVTSVTYASGKTTVVLRNVSLPTRLDGLDIGIMPSSTPLYHPDTVFADGTTLTQNGNVLSVNPASDTTRGIVNKQDVINFVRAAILDAAYPVGAIYISTVATSPATLFGGTWEAFGGRFLIGANSTYGAGTTGGAATVTLTADQMPKHSHTASTNSTGAHTHTRGTMDITGRVQGHANAAIAQNEASGCFVNPGLSGRNIDTGGGNSAGGLDFKASNNWTGSTSSAGAHTHTVTVDEAGKGQAHSNMPPYLSVYMWKRTA